MLTKNDGTRLTSQSLENQFVYYTERNLETIDVLQSLGADKEQLKRQQKICASMMEVVRDLDLNTSTIRDCPRVVGLLWLSSMIKAGS